VSDIKDDLDRETLVIPFVVFLGGSDEEIEEFLSEVSKPIGLNPEATDKSGSKKDELDFIFLIIIHLFRLLLQSQEKERNLRR